MSESVHVLAPVFIGLANFSNLAAHSIASVLKCEESKKRNRQEKNTETLAFINFSKKKIKQTKTITIQTVV